ncbi:transcription repressor OFP12-like [Olea europaea var. sylvestris]|uniref:transcription repressor OFP12-like n=1 Tax=Olea europaea var. sylvestris TaxID=158386 RepID=UPI000C1CD1E5|nr:transcription repressor OFP12-like [Olea europaea var. sylvestris]
MSKVLWKSFNLCIARLKCLPTITFSRQPPPKEEEKDLIKNFYSLYDSDTDYIPDFGPIQASQRFFFSSPGRSNAIIEPSECPPRQAVVEGGVAIQTYSLNPYVEFRKSMQEMIEERGFTDVKADFEFLHELLLCYLTLNPTRNHKFIIGAFSDVIVSLMSVHHFCYKTQG